MATLVFKYMNPLWYAYALLLKLPLSILWFIVRLPDRTIRGIWNVGTKVWHKYQNPWARLFAVGLAVFTAIPGTWTWVFYEAAHVLGYGEQADWIVDTAVAIASTTWEAFKFGYTLAVA